MDRLKNIIQPKVYNFNRIIDLSFRLKTGREIVVNTPRHGRKPAIDISGQFLPNGNASNFRVSVTNLYTDSIVDILTSIEVRAGYGDCLFVACSGTVANVYTETPGPDKVTVFECVTAKYSEWLEATANISLSAGFTVSQFVETVAKALGYNATVIDSGVASISCPFPFMFNGKVSEALRRFKRSLPDVGITTEGDKLRVFSVSKAPKIYGVHVLKLLSQAPQFSGGTVSLVLPWQPNIKPGDVVQFPVDFGKKSLGALTFNSAIVDTIDFSFSTVGDNNQMSIMATPRSKMEE